MAVYEYVTGLVQGLTTGKPVKFPKIESGNYESALQDVKAAIEIFERFIGLMQDEGVLPKEGPLPAKLILNRIEKSFDAAFRAPWKEDGEYLVKTFKDYKEAEDATQIIHMIADSQGDGHLMSETTRDGITYRIPANLMDDILERSGRGRINS